MLSTFVLVEQNTKEQTNKKNWRRKGILNISISFGMAAFLARFYEVITVEFRE